MRMQFYLSTAWVFIDLSKARLLPSLSSSQLRPKMPAIKLHSQRKRSGIFCNDATLTHVVKYTATDVLDQS